MGRHQEPIMQIVKITFGQVRTFKLGSVRLLILRTEVGIVSHHRPEGYMSGA